MSKEENAEQHQVIFTTEEQLSAPSSIELPETKKQPGLILDDGSINWECPCLGGMVAGPCGTSFREAFSCFHYSEAEPKGSDCINAFTKMQECMQKYPKLYGPDENEDDLFGKESTTEVDRDNSQSKRNEHNEKPTEANDNGKPNISNTDEKTLAKK